MTYNNKRRHTRSKVWPDTEATIKVAAVFDDSRRHVIIKGIVKDLGASGMFVKTKELVPVAAMADIVIDFDPAAASPALMLRVAGQIIHSTREGVGIRFTSIDLGKLQKCIIGKMNKLEADAR